MKVAMDLIELLVGSDKFNSNIKFRQGYVLTRCEA